nr:hypothetical protein [Parerythrobacter lacustris]
MTHAYGAASDVPGLLRMLAQSTGPRESSDTETWFSLWSALCHQGDTYTASFAALPHLVDLACAFEGPIDFGFFQLPAAIEISRASGRGPSIPDDLAPAYHASVARLSEAVVRHLADDWDEDTLLSVLSALAAAKGNARISEAIMNLDDDLITRLIDLDF